MPKPNSVSTEDIIRYSEFVDSDPFITADIAKNPVIREVCIAGQWLMEELDRLNCSDEIIGRILFTAGKESFGRPDTWEVHQNILNEYINGTLEFEEELN